MGSFILMRKIAQLICCHNECAQATFMFFLLRAQRYPKLFIFFITIQSLHIYKYTAFKKVYLAVFFSCLLFSVLWFIREAEVFMRCRYGQILFSPYIKLWWISCRRFSANWVIGMNREKCTTVGTFNSILARYINIFYFYFCFQHFFY